MSSLSRSMFISLLASAAALASAGVGLTQPAGAQDDPFRNLEAPKAPEALAWARARTAETREALGNLPHHDQIAAELKSVLNTHEAAPSYFLLGKRMLRLRRNADHPYGLLEVAARAADGTPETWRTALDVGDLRRKEGKPYTLTFYDAKNACLAEVGRCILSLSPGGGDGVELREFDLDAGAFVPGGYRVDQAARTQFTWLSADRVLIASAQPGEPLTNAKWPAQVRLWRRGEALAASPVVFKASATDSLMELGTFGEGAARRGVATVAVDYSHFKLSVIDGEGRTTALALPQALKPFGFLCATDHKLIVQLAEAATLEGSAYPAESLLAYDVDAARGRRRISAVFIPKGDDIVNDAEAWAKGTRSRVWFAVVNHLRKRLVTAVDEPSGWRIESRPPLDSGMTLMVVAADPVSDEALVRQEGFLTPLRLDLMVPGRVAKPIYTESPAFDASKLTVDIRHARSADGTVIDYYLVHPRQSLRPGQTPTLMTGYGAFGVSYTPDYLGNSVGGPAIQLWFERGGALALPIIRGGGERGEAWHRSAMRENRQRSYDDFIAVAKDLEAGFTKPARVGVFGSSNGGLLAATVGVEQPDLFGAVVSDVPLTDMLRFPEMGMGAAWENEYGDPANPVMRPVLMRYSPYQNVRAGVKYPPFLLTVSTEDQRVGPGHARKLAARLLSVGAPTYLYEDEEGGHDVSNALERPDLMSLRMTFLIDTLMGQ